MSKYNPRGPGVQKPKAKYSSTCEGSFELQWQSTCAYHALSNAFGLCIRLKKMIEIYERFIQTLEEPYKGIAEEQLQEYKKALSIIFSVESYLKKAKSEIKKYEQ